MSPDEKPSDITKNPDGQPLAPADTKPEIGGPTIPSKIPDLSNIVQEGERPEQHRGRLILTEQNEKKDDAD